MTTEALAQNRPIHFYNTLGFLSISFWSFTVIFARTMSQDVGKFRSSALAFTLAGVLFFLIRILKEKNSVSEEIQQMFRLPTKYLLACGACFSLHLVFFYSAIGLAPTPEAVIVVGLLNYLWPSAIFIFSIPILKKKASWLLIPGMLAAFLGIALTSTHGKFSLEQLFGGGKNTLIAYAMATIDAVFWGLYSNFNRLWGKDGANGIPLFMVASGLILGLLSVFDKQEPVWSVPAVSCIVLLAIFPTALANWFWDLGLRKGNAELIVSGCYFIPIFSTIITGLFLKVSLEFSLLLGCALVTIGSFLSRAAFKQKV